MRAAEQLDLFRHSAEAMEQSSSGGATRPVIAYDTLDDDSLVAALANAGIRDCAALAAEAARRRLAAAVPVLELMCLRLTGFGTDRIMPEQAAAVEALATIGGSDAAQTLVRLIAKGVVQGPCLQRAVSAAAQLEAQLPSRTALALLRHDDPRIRADACRCAHSLPEAVPLLGDLLDDLHPHVRTAAACALGRMGRREVRSLLVRFLRTAPSAELVGAIAPIADEECIILLGRVARTVPHLTEAALDALDAIDHPRAEKIAADIRQNRPT
jgi:hypothetical protein